jgi:hypothetical protein
MRVLLSGVTCPTYGEVFRSSSKPGEMTNAIAAAAIDTQRLDIGELHLDARELAGVLYPPLKTVIRRAIGRGRDYQRFPRLYWH